MKIEQLRIVSEIVNQGFSVSRAGEALGTPQPAVSRHLRALEHELGIDIFARNPKRLLGLTRAGAALVEVMTRILADTENVARIARDFAQENRGTLTIATTHTQARYALPRVIERFSKRYPDVELMLRQSSPADIVDLVRAGQADVCIGSDSPADEPRLVFFPCYSMHRVIVAPPGHPLVKVRRVTLETVARYPIITYDAPFVARSRLLRAFEAKELKPKIVLSAIDTDVIKTYVQMGLGIGIVAELAYDRARDKGLRAIPARHLFEANTIYLGIRRADYLRNYVYDFIGMFAPRLTREVVSAGQRSTKQ